MMLLGSLVNMLAIFAGCFVGVTLGRFIPERFNSALEKGHRLCVFYIGLDGVLAGQRYASSPSSPWCSASSSVSCSTSTGASTRSATGWSAALRKSSPRPPSPRAS